jgi:hypothetical protein
MGNKVSTEASIRDIKRKTRKKYSAEEKNRIGAICIRSWAKPTSKAVGTNRQRPFMMNWRAWRRENPDMVKRPEAGIWRKISPDSLQPSNLSISYGAVGAALSYEEVYPVVSGQAPDLRYVGPGRAPGSRRLWHPPRWGETEGSSAHPRTTRCGKWLLFMTSRFAARSLQVSP